MSNTLLDNHHPDSIQKVLAADLAEQLLASVEDEVTDADMFGEHEADIDIENPDDLGRSRSSASGRPMRA